MTAREECAFCIKTSNGGVTYSILRSIPKTALYGENTVWTCLVKGQGYVKTNMGNAQQAQNLRKKLQKGSLDGAQEANSSRIPVLL